MWRLAVAPNRLVERNLRFLFLGILLFFLFSVDPTKKTARAHPLPCPSCDVTQKGAFRSLETENLFYLLDHFPAIQTTRLINISSLPATSLDAGDLAPLQNLQ